MKDCRKSDRVLLVEGENDLHVFLHLWGRLVEDDSLGSRPEFCIEDKGGIDPLVASIGSYKEYLRPFLVRVDSECNKWKENVVSWRVPSYTMEKLL